MAIQMRRGESRHFDPTKMVPGEWAVSTDNSKIYMCFGAGNVIEVGTAESIAQYVDTAEAWAVGKRRGGDVDPSDETYHNNSKYYSQQANISATNANESEANALSYAGSASDSADDAQEFSESAEAALEEIQNAMARITPTMEIDFNTGHLISTGTYFDFLINNNGHLNWGIA